MTNYSELKKLLWSEVATWSVNCESWQRSSEALGEFLGKKTVEEVALELLAENEALRKRLLQCVVIELPQDLDWRSVTEIRDMCADRIRAAGLKVKP